MNHPATVWSNFEAAQRLPREKKEGRGSTLKQELAKAQQRNFELEKELARRDDGNDFTLSMRTPDDELAALLLNWLGADRGDKVYRALGLKLGKKTKKASTEGGK